MMADGEEDGPFDLGHAGRGERGAERLRIDAPLQQRGEPLAQQHRWPGDAVAAASGAASVRVWQVMSTGYPKTGWAVPKVVRVAYRPDAVHDHSLLTLGARGAHISEKPRLATLRFAHVFEPFIREGF